jgi:hypothetical protein
MTYSMIATYQKDTQNNVTLKNDTYHNWKNLKEAQQEKLFF